MDTNLSKEELWKIYRALPESLQEALFSPDTSEAVWHICGLCEINEVSKVAKRVGEVLMGLLPPENLKETLKKELNLDEDTASKLDVYLQHYIFNPLADDLRELYHPEEKETQLKEVSKEETKTRDIYREPIE